MKNPDRKQDIQDYVTVIYAIEERKVVSMSCIVLIRR